MADTVSRPSVNLIADLGEGYGSWRMGDDAALLDLVSSANVACGFHAGDPVIMDETVRMCVEKGVAVCAHPGFDDRRNFGRVRMEVPQKQLYADTLYQLGAIKAFTDKYGVSLAGVNPHGRLGNLIKVDPYFADPVYEAIHDFDPKIKIGGGPGSVIGKLALAGGHLIEATGHPDRNIEPDGSLVLRTKPDALIKDPDVIVARAIEMIETGSVLAVDGKTRVPMECQTLLLHGDKPEALETARKLHAALVERGIEIKA